jgi:hypothetical protein
MPTFDSQRYVFLLPLLGATAEQNDDSFSVFAKVNPVAWTEINADFKDPAADALHIREVSQAQPVECSGHSPRRLGVEPVKPLPEEVSSVTAEIFPDVNHLDNGSIYYPIGNRENPRLCRGGSRSLTFTGIAPGLCFYLLLATRLKGMVHERRPYGTPNELLVALTSR